MTEARWQHFTIRGKESVPDVITVVGRKAAVAIRMPWPRMQSFVSMAKRSGCLLI